MGSPVLKERAAALTVVLSTQLLMGLTEDGITREGGLTMCERRIVKDHREKARDLGRAWFFFRIIYCCMCPPGLATL